MIETLAVGLKDAAAALGLSHWTLRQWIKQGRVRPVRLGRRVVLEPSELMRLIQEGSKEGR